MSAHRAVSVPRFFVAADLTVGGAIALPAAVAHHAIKVLRLRAGAPITLFNGRGGEYRARLAADATAAIEAFDPVERESPLAITLIQALVAQDKIDWIVEKSVELGVARIVVAPAARSIVRLPPARLASRLARWNDIAIAACCQCGRNRPPSVVWSPALGEALAAADAPVRLILSPSAARGLAMSAPSQPIAMAIGPEGDFTDDELAAAERHGFRRTRFGPRVLRTETAAIAVVAALQSLLGDSPLVAA